jgi:DTW domain-containing protein YfiP
VSALVSPRKYRTARCPGCGLHEHLCVCAELPTVMLSTRFVIVQHVRERHKPTNTGRLAHRMLANSRLVHWPPPRTGSFDATAFAEPDTAYLLLFPRADATTLTPEMLRPRPGRRPCVVVLDGSWHQCSRMTRRVPRVSELGCVRLPPGPPSSWAARRQHDAHGLATIEAIIRVIEIAEGKDAAMPLVRGFLEVNRGVLRMRGRAAL